MAILMVGSVENKCVISRDIMFKNSKFRNYKYNTYVDYEPFLHYNGQIFEFSGTRTHDAIR